MKDILVIAGTNRPDSTTEKVAEYIRKAFSQEARTTSLGLESLNDRLIITKDMYDKNYMDAGLKNMQDNILIPARNWIIVSPEYNGSFPGILKTWLDALSVLNAAETFHHKKVGLVGVSSGRAGNLRGMDHLTAVLHYLHMEVMPYKLPVSSIHMNMEKDGTLKDEVSLPLDDFCKRFIQFIR